jgi:hypothetical protein
MGYLTNDIVTSGGLPTWIIKPLLDSFIIPVFLETGTAGGSSVKEASELFEKCFTIELLENTVTETIDKDNVSFHVGNTVDVLPKIISELNESHNQSSILFWLDAHYSGLQVNETGYKDCYILEELEIVSRYDGNAIILIDDARLFIGMPPYPLDPRDWASIDEIFSLIKEKFPNNRTTIMDDYIFSFPEQMKSVIDSEWRKNYDIRYPDASTKLRTKAKDVFNAIKEYLK